MLKILEHASASYAPRTYHNARQADLTVAVATDFSTAGEKLTQKAAGANYLAIDLSQKPIIGARQLYSALKARNARTLNIAGNGIYTLDRSGWTQDRLNAYLYVVLGIVHEHWPLQRVVSGGQTGVDIAGIVAANALGIPAIATLPKGFKQRARNGQDADHTKAEIEAQVREGAQKILADLSLPEINHR